MSMSETGLNWELVFSLLGILVGVVSVVWVYTSLRLVGGKLSRPFQFVILGTLFQVSAFIYTAVFHQLKLYPMPGVNLHEAIMVLGMLCFVLAAKKFADLTK